jgi:hypothetical protein
MLGAHRKHAMELIKGTTGLWDTWVYSRTNGTSNENDDDGNVVLKLKLHYNDIGKLNRLLSNGHQYFAIKNTKEND